MISLPAALLPFSLLFFTGQLMLSMHFLSSNIIKYIRISRAGFKGGKLGSCPGASTTKGPPQKYIDIGLLSYYNCKCMSIIAFEGGKRPPIMILPRASTELNPALRISFSRR